METKITKKIIALISAIIMSVNAFAQFDTNFSKKEACDYLIKNSTCIFEGKIIPSSKKLFTTNDGATYSSVLVEVENIIKGNLQKGTIEIIKFQYQTDKNGNRQSFESEDMYEPEIPNELSLFFSTENKQVPNASGITKKNNMPLKIIEVIPASSNTIPKQDPRCLLKDFNTLDELYDYLNINYSLGINKTLLEKKSPISTQSKVNTNTLYSQRLKNVENDNKYFKTKAPFKKTSNSSGCTELFISEYLDGQSSNNAVEIYNPTGLPIALSNYKLLIYHNASYTPTTIALTGTISAYGTHVVVQQGASSSISTHANQTTNNLNFSGDVCTVLSKGTTHIDKIGEIGVANPSGSWTLTPSGGTNNSDIRRKYTISSGDTSWTNCKSEWNVFPDDSVSNFGQQTNICGVDPDLNINFANPYSVDSTNGKSYFEFNITAASIGANTYLDNAPVRIQYNTSAFGTYIATYNKVTAVLVSPFDTNTYVNPNLHLSDVSADTINIGFGTNYNKSSWTRILITSTPIKLMRIFIEVQNCNQSSALSFVDQSFTGGFLTWYVAGQHDNPNTATDISYTNVNYGSDLNYNIPTSACGMQITDFTSPIDAGIGNVLTITGTGFGNTRGSGKVRFKNADNGGATYVPILNNIDYISWSDNQIQIRLPNFITNPSRQIIGGGNFIVTNNVGQSDTSIINSSNQPFYICYSLRQVWATDSTKKLEVDLRNDNHLGGYTIRFNPTDFPVGSDRRAIFQKAMHDWICMTGVNWIVGADTTITFNSTVADNVNYISFTNDSLTPAITASTYPKNISCTGYGAVLSEADMLFNGNKTFVYDTTLSQNIPSGQIDFYGVCLHELGHFIGLGHSTDPTNLMYYSGLTGYIASANRKSLVMGSCPVDGGTYSVGQSSSNATTCSGLLTMVPENSSSCTMGINKYLANNFFFNLYPNPSDGSNININFQAPTNTQAQIIVYDMMGRAVYSNDIKNRNDINSTYSLDVSNLSQGMYMVNLVIDKVKVCQKFIKQ